MTPTDDERRRVAARLRSVAQEVRHSGYLETIKHVRLAIFEDLGQYRPNETLDRLADLIEPELERTCRMEYAGEVPPSVKYSCYFCSECGSPIYNDMEPSYCLYCGAKVKCVAEIKVDGERLEKLAHDAAAELTGVDREALLALADELEQETGSVYGVCMGKTARRIREALGVTGHADA